MGPHEIDTPLFTELVELVREFTDELPDPVEPKTPLKDFLGSLDMIEVVEALEKQHGIRIDDEDLKDVETFADAYDLAASKIAPNI